MQIENFRLLLSAVPLLLLILAGGWALYWISDRIVMGRQREMERSDLDYWKKERAHRVTLWVKSRLLGRGTKRLTYREPAEQDRED